MSKEFKIMLSLGVALVLSLFFLVAYADDAMVKIPQGYFIMGSNIVDEKEHWKQYGSREPWFLNEHPRHKKYLPTYYIDTYEVTNAQYRDYLRSAQVTIPQYWLENGYAFSLKENRIQQMPLSSLRHLASNVFKFDVDADQLSKDNILALIKKRWQKMNVLPVTHMSWYDAARFCKKNNKRLPTEAEWEKAARGDAGAAFVIGNHWISGVTNVGEEHWPFGVAPIGSYPQDQSAYGVFDMAGNAYEWVSDWYKPYKDSSYSSHAFGEKYKVVRGSGFGKDGHYFLIHYQRVAYRSYMYPDDEKSGQGFRCAMSDR